MSDAIHLFRKKKETGYIIQSWLTTVFHNFKNNEEILESFSID